MGIYIMNKLFKQYQWNSTDQKSLDTHGHLILPNLLVESAKEKLTKSLSSIQDMLPGDPERPPNHYAAEFDSYLASLITHPHMLDLVSVVLGDSIRFDHCVSLNRLPGNSGVQWHSHEYGDGESKLGFLRIFLYVNGFEVDDGGLKVVSGSHLFRDSTINAESDAKLENGWLKGRRHPDTGVPLHIEEVSAPTGSVVLMWTHAAHAVSPRQKASKTRWAVVYAYRNPGLPSEARWISKQFERNGVPEAEYLMSLY